MLLPLDEIAKVYAGAFLCTIATHSVFFWEQNMFCPSCAAANPDTANWCSQCGAQLRPAPPGMATPAQAQPGIASVPSHKALAFFSLLCGLCCCIPGFILAIVSMVSALSVNSRLAANDIAGAQIASRRASFWGWFAILCGIVGLIANIVLGVLYGGAIIAQVTQGR